MGSKIDEILSRGKPQASPVEDDAGQGDKFFSVLAADGLEESYFEVRFRDGSKTCFPYGSLSWFNYIPEEGIDLDFDGCAVFIKGRGLDPKLWNGIKQRRVAWVKEADVELQDHAGNEVFISEITVIPPDSPPEEEEAE